MRPTRASQFARAGSPRHGFTLVELLVVMAIIIALSLLALMLIPVATRTDAVLKGTEELRAQCKIAQALAAATGQPRGVRLLVSPGSRFGTEIQLLEAPPVTPIDTLALVAATGDGRNDTNGVSGPYVDLVYDLYNGKQKSIDPNVPGTPQSGTIMKRHCRIYRLTQAQVNQVGPGSLLVLPTLGAWSRIISSAPLVGNPSTVINGTTYQNLEVVLDVYPDTLLGASTAYRTFHAGIFGPPVPLLGQANIPLPLNVGVDMDMSTPAGSSDPAAPANLLNYDILFAPDGTVLGVTTPNTPPAPGGVLNPTNAGIYLWMRDMSKGVTLAGVPQGPALATAFRRGGEQHVIGISNGLVSAAPIQQVDPGTGMYPPGGPFLFVKKKLN
jgi:prepilin-type N-terminal cleavage/methylation domain-containing protein